VSVIADLIRAGVDPDLIERVANEISTARALGRSEVTPQRTARQERNARYYESKASERRLKSSKQDASDDIKTDLDESVLTPPAADLTPRAPAFFIGEDSSYISPSDTSYPQAPLKSESVFENPKAAKPKPSDVRTILETVLTPEVAAGVIEHRKKLRKPLTAMGAEGLARKFAATGRPDDAARTMVERGWQGFKGEWFENDQSTAEARAGPPNARRDTWTETADWFLRGEDDDGSRREKSPHEVVELSREDWTRA
jgi:hypothetical protein